MKEQLENKQVWIYIVIVIIAAIVGLAFPSFSQGLNHWVSIVLAILMYSMFSQIPFTSLKQGFNNRPFMLALGVTNFIAVPILVFLLTRFLPNEPALLLGIYLVLLTPCIDYVIVFTALGRGDAKAMLMATPMLFVLQMVLLPVYLWLFLGKEAVAIVAVGPFIEAFVTLIVLPLMLAVVLQLVALKSKRGSQILDLSAWLPVPFMAVTLFVIIASQIEKITNDSEMIIKAIPIYIAFMVIMPFIARWIGQVFKLETSLKRALVFSGGTRNSLVVLPLALALPPTINTIVAAIIVTQTLVEIVGELIYIKVVPSVVIKDFNRKSN